MTPDQQKARELVEKFLNEQMSISKAKQCALIACDEMIQQNGELYLNVMDGEYYRTKNAFLFDIKQEITKLT